MIKLVVIFLAPANNMDDMDGMDNGSKLVVPFSISQKVFLDPTTWTVWTMDDMDGMDKDGRHGQ